MIFSALLCTGLIPIRQFTFQHKHQPDAVAPACLTRRISIFAMMFRLPRQSYIAYVASR